MGSGVSPENGRPAGTPVPPLVRAYLYPWDIVGDAGLVSRLDSAGLSHVVVAAAYHSVRAATPFHPQHRFVIAETAALYRPVRAGVWAGRRLSPFGAPWTGSDDCFGQAVEALDRDGVGVSAWIVLNHNSALGRAHSDLIVRNCFGDGYEWALCPANEEVREYAALLALEAVRDLPLQGVSLEAYGQMGAEHGSHHDKATGTYGPLGELVLSICCCDACRRTWSLHGLDPVATVQTLCEAFEVAQSGAGAAEGPEELLGPALAAQLLACRQHHTDALVDTVLGELSDGGHGLRVTLHAKADSWATGASPGLTPRWPRRAEAVLVPVKADSSDNVDVIATARALVPEGVAVAGYVNLLGPAEPDANERRARSLLDAGADELHLYHFGLANRSQLTMFSRLAASSF
ncbi:MAG: hypothetical protein ABSD97_10685 [Acidimicrobiales bacterium]